MRPIIGACKLDEYCVTGGGGGETASGVKEARLGPDGMVMEIRKDGVGMYVETELALYRCIYSRNEKISIHPSIHPSIHLSILYH
jgi:hypothetical protein